MNKLLVLFILALSLMGFNSSSYAINDGAKASEQGQASAQNEQQQKKKKKDDEEEEPECE